MQVVFVFAVCCCVYVWGLRLWLGVCVCVCVCVRAHLEGAWLQGGEELSWREIESFQRVTALGLKKFFTRGGHQLHHALHANHSETLCHAHLIECVGESPLFVGRLILER